MRCTVLIVDDNESLAENLAELLEDEGFDTRIATNGPEALELLDGLPSPRLLLTDVHMPGMNGVELLKKASSEHGLRAIVITAYAHDDLLAEAERGGAAAVLTKPLDLDALTRLCTDVCGCSE